MPACRIQSCLGLLLLLVAGCGHADLAKGIRHFQALEYTEAKAEFDLLTETNGTANLYLGMIHDIRFHMPRGIDSRYMREWLDRDKAIAYYERAIELGEPYAHFQIAGLHGLSYSDHCPSIIRRSDGPIRFKHAAMEALTDRIADGDGIAAYMLAWFRFDDADSREHADRAYRLLLAEALEGRPYSQFLLARAFETHLLYENSGRGRIDKDHIHAFAWYTVAAAHGEEHARVHQREAAKHLKVRHYDDAEELARELLARFQ